MQYLYGAIFLLVGFAIIAIITCAALVMSGWRGDTKSGPITLAVFGVTAALFLSRYSFNWHTLVKPVIVAIVFYAAVETGSAVARRVPEGGQPKKLC